MKEKIVSETISKVLYPNDAPAAGKRLRLAQQYFFVSCSLRDMLRILLPRSVWPARRSGESLIQLNDTHPSIGVAELMRLLVDERAPRLGQGLGNHPGIFGYTDHTLLPEALETWPLPMFGAICRATWKSFTRSIGGFSTRSACASRVKARVRRLSLIGEAGEKRVRMAHLACVGSHAMNGVAALHTELLKASVLKDFCELWPERFSNKTDGVTRGVSGASDPGLRALARSTSVTGGWRAWRAAQARAPSPTKASSAPRGGQSSAPTRSGWRASSLETGIELDPDWMFGVLAKRIHEYKRQHLDLLHIVSRYLRLKEGPELTIRRGRSFSGARRRPVTPWPNALSSSLIRSPTRSTSTPT